MPSINRAAVDADGYKFAVALGDITWDRFWYATGMDIESVPQHLANHNFPMPFYCVHGNHDYDPSVPATDNPNTNAIQRFCNVFGPTFYSMDKGGVHFVMLDNIVYKNEVKEGEAYIWCTLGDEKPQKYSVQLSSIDINNTGVKNFKVKITDKRLLERSGGIVQGMSGSPIIQNGRIVGAVTHVLINDPTCGYGIFIENMLKAMPDILK